MAVAYVAERIFDGLCGVVEDGAIVVDDGRIVAVGSVRTIPSDVKVVELGNSTPPSCQGSSTRTYISSGVPRRRPKSW